MSPLNVKHTVIKLSLQLSLPIHLSTLTSHLSHLPLLRPGLLWLPEAQLRPHDPDQDQHDRRLLRGGLGLLVRCEVGVDGCEWGLHGQGLVSMWGVKRLSRGGVGTAGWKMSGVDGTNSAYTSVDVCMEHNLFLSSR